MNIKNLCVVLKKKELHTLKKIYCKFEPCVRLDFITPYVGLSSRLASTPKSMNLMTVKRYIYLFGVLRRFQHCISYHDGQLGGQRKPVHTVSQVLFCKLPTNGKQLPASHFRSGRKPNPNLRGGRRDCYHSATVAPK